MALQSVAKRIVAIDAYSPHFAFIDSIYTKKDRELESLDVTCVLSKMTFAGMHSAASRAFKVIQKQVGDSSRKPTLVIYEDAYAISDLESSEQYRIFVRHVMPSERMWDGMFTVFVESAQPDGDWNILQSYASMTLNLRGGEAIAIARSSAGPMRAAKIVLPRAAAIHELTPNDDDLATVLPGSLVWPRPVRRRPCRACADSRCPAVATCSVVQH